MVESCAAAEDHLICLELLVKGHHLVRSGLYGEAWPSLSNLFRTGPGKLWFGLSGSVQIWSALQGLVLSDLIWSGPLCSDLICLVRSGLLLSGQVWSGLL